MKSSRELLLLVTVFVTGASSLIVEVVGLRSTPLYHSPEALRVVGPSAFGYQLPFVALQ